MKYIAFLVLLGCVGALIGCDSNPTNAPSKTAVDDANATRAKAIDDNPNLTPEQKAQQKKMMGLGESKPADRAKN